MNKPRVFVTSVIPDEGLEPIFEACQAEVWTGELPPSRETILERVQGVDGIVSLLAARIDGDVMDAAGPRLKVVSNYAVGYDNVDVVAATARGIPVGNTPDVLTDTTADFAFALLMAAARRVAEGDRYVRDGRWMTWGPKLLLGQDVTGATLGIVGFGRIGRAVASRAQGFGMRVLYADPYCSDDGFAREIGARCVGLDTLLRESDFVSIHTPLTDETLHLIDANALARMKRTAILINTSRGPVVDADALYDALASRTIVYAALDVTDPEPLPAGSPLLDLENVIVTPHIASASVVTRGKMARMAAANLLAGLRGDPLPHCVNPDVYAR